MFLPDLRQKENPHSGCLQATSKPETAATAGILVGIRGIDFRRRLL